MQEPHNCPKYQRLEQHVTPDMDASGDEDAAGSGNLNGCRHRPGTSNADASPDDNSGQHNDCSKKCSSSGEGARPKVRHYNNIANGGDHQKVNNTNAEGVTCYRFQNGAASTSRGCAAGASGSNDLDGYMRNNVDSPSDVEKCPSKVRNGSIDGGGRRKYRRARSSVEEESSSGNEGEEDCCVYTYKGSLQADLPNSFLILDRLANGLEQAAEDLPREPPHEENNRSQAGSSPDNEFLEMDFDPGPSIDQDSDVELDAESGSPVPELPSEQDLENDLSADNDNAESADFVNNVTERWEEVEPQPGPSSAQTPPPPPRRTICLPFPACNYQCPSKKKWPVRDTWGHHCFNGDLCTPWDASEMKPVEGLVSFPASSDVRLDGEDPRKYNLFSDLYHCIMAKRLIMDKNASFPDVAKAGTPDSSDEMQDGSPPVDRTMIWSEKEACNKQVTQISTSACGVTAVINVMMALNTPCSLDSLNKGVGTRLRQESAPLPQYLLSRSSAGATHEDLLRGVDAASEGRLYSRFFTMYPERRLSLSKWLSYWMKKGAVPIATLNLQAGLPPWSLLPDAWHHQMIFGVSPRGVFLTNPLECVSECHLMAQLCSPSVLKVKRSDVLQRWTAATDLRPLMCQPDVRWAKMNVLGQVVNMIRESTSTAPNASQTATKYVSLPASYSSGITLVIPRDSPGFQELVAYPELPLVHP